MLDADTVHALSNHFAVIIGFVELLLGECPPNDPKRADLLEIRTAAIEAARLLGHDFGKK
jgi:hypothetical protein